MVVFCKLRIVPGDPLAAMLCDAGGPAAAEELRKKFGLDQPVYVQYAKWFGRLLMGDMGNSIYGSRIEVSRVIREALPRTLSLTGLSFLIALVIAVPAGLISALKRNSALDRAGTLVAFLGRSMPDFGFAIMLLINFAAGVIWVPAAG